MNEAIENKLEELNLKILQITQRVGREASSVRLLGASKKVPPERMRLFYNAGLKCFGENRVQELKIKVEVLPPDCEWHFIGALQTNKVRDAVRLSSLIHSVDRAELVEEIENRAAQMGKNQRVLIEVNVGGEASKHGVVPDCAQDLVEMANQKPHLEVIGFMTVAPFVEEAEKVRPYFAKLRKLRDEIQKKTGMILPELSMGMSHDFEVAIEEGATMVRIGTDLFGERK